MAFHGLEVGFVWQSQNPVAFRGVLCLLLDTSVLTFLDKFISSGSRSAYPAIAVF